MTVMVSKIYSAERWFEAGQGPRYQQLRRYLRASIRSGELAADTQLPPERVLADLTDVSRVTVRRAISALADEGLVEQRRGAGTFVRPQIEKLEQSLSSLVSFSRLRTGSEVCYGIPSNPIEYWASIEMKWNCEYITRKFVGSDPIEPLKMLHAAMEKDFNATTTEKAPY